MKAYSDAAGGASPVVKTLLSTLMHSQWGLSRFGVATTDWLWFCRTAIGKLTDIMYLLWKAVVAACLAVHGHVLETKRTSARKQPLYCQDGHYPSLSSGRRAPLAIPTISPSLC